MKSQTLRGCAVGWLCGAAVAGTLAAADPAPVEDIEQVRQNMKQALAYRDQAAQEANAWRTQQAEIGQLQALATAERNRLNDDLAHSRQALDELDQKRRTIAARNAFRTRFEAIVTERLPALTEEVLRQHSRWPEMLQTRTQPQIDLLHRNRTATDFTSRRRTLDAALSALEEAGEFQSKINRTTVMRPLPDGRDALFEVLYFGLAAGYYYSTELARAGTIRFDGQAWIWTEDNALLDPLLRFSTILAGDAPADWVDLPVLKSTQPAETKP